MIDGYVHPNFAGAVSVFADIFAGADMGGASLALTHRGEVVADVWTGSVGAAGSAPWQRDTIAMSFSTTKGVASMALHLLVDRGLVNHDEPVATYWPDFAQASKDAITVRELMTHRAGLHAARGLVEHTSDLLDADAVAKTLAATAPDPRRMETSGYHAITYGWLVGEVVRRVTGQSLTDFVRQELADPLGADGLFIGVPTSERHRIAPLLPQPTEKERARSQKAPDALGRFKSLRPFVDALLVDDFEVLFLDPKSPLADTEMAAVNGFFTARSLAAMYGILANGGEYGGRRYLQQSTVDDLSRVQVTTRDYVLQIPMKWRTGYHRAFTTGRQPKAAFGHFGYGGSGAWADPETGLSVALTLNKLSLTTPVADVRLAKIGGAALQLARQLS
jgi:CubicO group peptidase (beta-lactamase class C family)